jgi:hypothetical protein
MSENELVIGIHTVDLNPSARMARQTSPMGADNAARALPSRFF